MILEMGRLARRDQRLGWFGCCCFGGYVLGPIHVGERITEFVRAVEQNRAIEVGGREARIAPDQQIKAAERAFPVAAAIVEDVPLAIEFAVVHRKVGRGGGAGNQDASCIWGGRDGACRGGDLGQFRRGGLDAGFRGGGCRRNVSEQRVARNQDARNDRRRDRAGG